MPKVEHIITYKLNELPDSIQERVIDNWRASGDWPELDDVIDSMQALIEGLRLEVGRWSLGGRGEKVPLKHPYEGDACYYVSEFFAEDDARDLEEVRGLELQNYLMYEGFHLVGNPHYDFQMKQFKAGAPGYDKPKFQISIFESCPLTGVCFDDDMLKPLQAFLLFPDQDYTIRDILDDIEEAIVKTYNNELDHLNSEAHIREIIAINDYNFTIEGSIF